MVSMPWASDARCRREKLRRLVRNSVGASVRRLSYRWDTPTVTLPGTGRCAARPATTRSSGRICCSIDTSSPVSRAGYIADVGAYDGVTHSNSYFLEQHRGWSGVCVEANPEAFVACKAARSSLCVHAAICETGSTAEFLIAPGNSVMLSGLSALTDARQRRRIARDAGCEVETRTVVVPARRLTDVLRAAEIVRLDLLLVDVEGAERGVLRTIHLASFGWPVVVVENNYREYEIVQMLRTAGYRLIARVGRDEVYLPDKRCVLQLT